MLQVYREACVVAMTTLKAVLETYLKILQVFPSGVDNQNFSCVCLTDTMSHDGSATSRPLLSCKNTVCILKRDDFWGEKKGR